MQIDKKSFFRNDMFIIYLVSGFILLLHLVSNAIANYGIFRDELYYIACSNRPALGYVDHPPFSIYILAITKLIFGESMFAIRIIPSVASGISVFFLGLIIRKMGGGKFAIVIGTLAFIFGGVFLSMFTLFSMNSIGILLWIISVYVFLFIIENPKPKLWILLGLLMGIGLLNKIDFLWFCAGLFFALIFTEQRKQLKTIWPYLAGIFALVIFMPYIIWNIQNNWAHLEFMQNASSGKYSGITRLDFLLSAIMIFNPVTALIWLPGIYYYFFTKDGKTYRPLGIIFLTTFLILLINSHSKSEYLTSAFPLLFAAGGIMIEKISIKKYLRWFKFAVLSLLLIFGFTFLPFGLPVLHVETFIKYADFWGLKPASPENIRLNELPQFHADMFGWEELAQSMANVYKMIPPEEREKTLIVVRNYGEAGAIEYYKGKYNLPPVVSPHNNYWIWGKSELGKDYQTLIVFSGREEDHRRSCDSVVQVYTHSAKYAISYETNRPVFICRGLKRSLAEIWKADRHFQ